MAQATVRLDGGPMDGVVAEMELVGGSSIGAIHYGEDVDAGFYRVDTEQLSADTPMFHAVWEPTIAIARPTHRAQSHEAHAKTRLSGHAPAR